MPSVLPTISEITTRISVIGKLTRMPVITCGAAAGRTICHRVFRRDKPNVRPVFASTGSMLRTPSSVLSRIGQAQKDYKDFHLVFETEKQHRQRNQHGRRHRPQHLDDDFEETVDSLRQAHKNTQRNKHRGGEEVTRRRALHADEYLRRDLTRGNLLPENAQDPAERRHDQRIDPLRLRHDLPRDQ